MQRTGRRPHLLLRRVRQGPQRAAARIRRIRSAVVARYRRLILPRAEGTRPAYSELREDAQADCDAAAMLPAVALAAAAAPGQAICRSQRDACVDRLIVEMQEHVDGSRAGTTRRSRCSTRARRRGSARRSGPARSATGRSGTRSRPRSGATTSTPPASGGTGTGRACPRRGGSPSRPRARSGSDAGGRVPRHQRPRQPRPGLRLRPVPRARPRRPPRRQHGARGVQGPRCPS